MIAKNPQQAAVILFACSFIVACNNDSASPKTSNAQVEKKASAKPEIKTAQPTPVVPNISEVLKTGTKETSEVSKPSITEVVSKIKDEQIASSAERAAKAKVEGIPSIANYDRAVQFATLPVTASPSSDNKASLNLLSGYRRYGTEGAVTAYYFYRIERDGFVVNRLHIDADTGGRVSDMNLNVENSAKSEAHFGHVESVTSVHGLGLDLSKDLSEIDAFAMNTHQLSDQQFAQLKEMYSFAILPKELGGMGYDSENAVELALSLVNNERFIPYSFRHAFFYLSSEKTAGTGLDLNKTEEFDLAVKLAKKFSGASGTIISYQRFRDELSYVETSVDQNGLGLSDKAAISQALALASLENSSSYKEAVNFARSVPFQSPDFYVSKDAPEDDNWFVKSMKNAGNNLMATYSGAGAIYKRPFRDPSKPEVAGLGLLRNPVAARAFADRVAFGEIRYTSEVIGDIQVFVPVKETTQIEQVQSYSPALSTIMEFAQLSMKPLIDGGFGMAGEEAAQFAFELAWLRFSEDYGRIGSDVSGVVSQNRIEQMQEHYFYALRLKDAEGNRVYSRRQALEFAREKVGLPQGGIPVSTKQ